MYLKLIKKNYKLKFITYQIITNIINCKLLCKKIQNLIFKKFFFYWNEITI